MSEPVPSMDELVRLAWEKAGITPHHARAVLSAVLPLVTKPVVDAIMDADTALADADVRGARYTIRSVRDQLRALGGG